MNDDYFVDTNVLIYCYTVTEPDTHQKARQIVMPKGTTTTTQVLPEMANTLLRKFKTEWPEIKSTLDEIQSQFTIHQNSPKTIHDAIRIANRYGYSFYDLLIIAAALESRCSVFYSEDMQAGQVIDDVLTIRNPF